MEPIIQSDDRRVFYVEISDELSPEYISKMLEDVKAKLNSAQLGDNS